MSTITPPLNLTKHQLWYRTKVRPQRLKEDGVCQSQVCKDQRIDISIARDYNGTTYDNLNYCTSCVTYWKKEQCYGKLARCPCCKRVVRCSNKWKKESEKKRIE